MGHASYTNLLLDPGSLLRVMRNLAWCLGKVGVSFERDVYSRARCRSPSCSGVAVEGRPTAFPEVMRTIWKVREGMIRLRTLTPFEGVEIPAPTRRFQAAASHVQQ